VFKVEKGIHVLATGTSVSNQSSGGRICNIRSRNDSDMATGEAVEHLSNSLYLWVVKGVRAGVGVDVQAVDGALMSSVESRSRVGRIGDEAVNGVRHLVAENREFVHGHGGLVLSVDALVSDQACGRDHVGGHTIANEENDVLGLALLGQVANEPGSLSLAAIVVVECSGVLSGLVKGNTAVRFRSDVYKRRRLCVPGKKVWYEISFHHTFELLHNLLTLPISKVPLLQLWFFNLEVLGCRLSRSTLLCDSEGKALIQRQSDVLRSVLRLVDLETDVEELACQEVGPVRGYLEFGVK
jgi:hypothetical protein